MSYMHPDRDADGEPLVVPEAPSRAPSVHVRAALTWLAIFPLVSAGLFVLEGVAGGWPPLLRAFVLTLVVVPLSVYLVVPALLRAYAWLRRGSTRTSVPSDSIRSARD